MSIYKHPDVRTAILRYYDEAVAPDRHADPRAVDVLDALELERAPMIGPLYGGGILLHSPDQPSNSQLPVGE